MSDERCRACQFMQKPHDVQIKTNKFRRFMNIFKKIDIGYWVELTAYATISFIFINHFNYTTTEITLHNICLGFVLPRILKWLG
jgi:hypothetical protein